jgi:hypothetical protein
MGNCDHPQMQVALAPKHSKAIELAGAIVREF